MDTRREHPAHLVDPKTRRRPRWRAPWRRRRGAHVLAAGVPVPQAGTAELTEDRGLGWPAAVTTAGMAVLLVVVPIASGRDGVTFDGLVAETGSSATAVVENVTGFVAGTVDGIEAEAGRVAGHVRTVGSLLP